MKIVNINTLNESQLNQAAQMLVDAFPHSWETLDKGLFEINGRWSEPDTLFLAAIIDGEVAGWCGILPQYSGNVFELHPLVVRADVRGQGIGRLLVEAISKAAKDKGGKTLWLGADDEREGGETSFANTDLYDDLPRRIKEFDHGTHQAAFYMKLGFKIVGVLPDANGIGKPDIFLAKSL
ncbi:MAG: GNAT family N-acetyltransferase [Defluviitaleaceae bacterium]|nr:GNAT family N-acetyltransferase [Defluviitaleaceae bacterium]